MHLEQSVGSRSEQEPKITSEVQRIKQTVQWKVMENLEFLKLPTDSSDSPMTEEQVREAFDHWIEFDFAARFEKLFSQYYFIGTDTKPPIRNIPDLVEDITRELKAIPANYDTSAVEQHA